MFECNVPNSDIFRFALGADASNWLQKKKKKKTKLFRLNMRGKKQDTKLKAR